MLNKPFGLHDALAWVKDRPNPTDLPYGTLFKVYDFESNVFSAPNPPKQRGGTKNRRPQAQFFAANEKPPSWDLGYEISPGPTPLATLAWSEGEISGETEGEIAEMGKIKSRPGPQKGWFMNTPDYKYMYVPSNHHPFRGAGTGFSFLPLFRCKWPLSQIGRSSTRLFPRNEHHRVWP